MASSAPLGFHRNTGMIALLVMGPIRLGLLAHAPACTKPHRGDMFIATPRPAMRLAP